MRRTLVLEENRVFCSIFVFLSLLFPFGLQADFQASGKLRGILTAKSATWIEVKLDGEANSRRFIPSWQGALPRQGGHLDVFVLNKFKDLRTGNRVELHWGFDQHFRVINVRTLKPFRSHGTSRGMLVAKGEHWIDVRIPQQRLQRFHAVWLGRLPEDGGGLDQEILAGIDKAIIGEEILFDWIYDDRKRITAFNDPNPPPDPDDEVVAFPPGYPYLFPPPPGQPWFPDREKGKVAAGLPDPLEFSKPDFSIQPIPPITPSPGGSFNPGVVSPPNPENPFDQQNPTPVQTPQPAPEDPFGAGAPPSNQGNPFDQPAPQPAPEDPFGAGAPPSNPENPFDQPAPQPAPEDPFGQAPLR